MYVHVQLCEPGKDRMIPKCFRMLRNYHDYDIVSWKQTQPADDPSTFFMHVAIREKYGTHQYLEQVNCPVCNGSVTDIRICSRLNHPNATGFLSTYQLRWWTNADVQRKSGGYLHLEAGTYSCAVSYIVVTITVCC
jgi:hypothetical protein